MLWFRLLDAMKRSVWISCHRLSQTPIGSGGNAMDQGRRTMVSRRKALSRGGYKPTCPCSPPPSPPFPSSTDDPHHNLLSITSRPNQLFIPPHSQHLGPTPTTHKPTGPVPTTHKPYAPSPPNTYVSAHIRRHTHTEWIPTPTDSPTPRLLNVPHRAH